MSHREEADRSPRSGGPVPQPFKSRTEAMQAESLWLVGGGA